MVTPPFRRTLPLALVPALVAAGCGGSGEADPLADGRRVYGRVCAAETFPSCADHVEWVTIGSEWWLDARGDTYGAPARPVGGMPAFARTLSSDQLAAVAAFERHRHGGVRLEEALADCGWPTPAVEPGPVAVTRARRV